MKSLFTTSLLLCCVAFFLQAQTPADKGTEPLTAATPESQGMSAERLARIDDMLNKAIADGDVPGMVALIARNGKIVYHKAFGYTDAEAGRRAGTGDIFRIASQTKAITATAVMMLWEEGKFRLDDPVSKFIPEFKNPQVFQSFKYEDTTFTAVPAEREITIRHLLTHTSGIGYGMIDPDDRFKMLFHKAEIIDAWTTKPITIEENTKKLAGLPLHFHPGEDYLYSEGLDVLGYFIEIVSGMPFDQFLRERIFDPLGMDDTWFYLPEEKADRLVAVQTREGDRWVHFQTPNYDPDFPVKGARTFFSGGGGLCSTAGDYATFLQMYLNGGALNGVRILSRTTINTIMSNQIGDFWGENGDRYYGLAFGVLTEQGVARGGQGSAGTFDWGGYFNTQYFADPQEQIIGILMKQTQRLSKDDSGWKFRLLVGQAVDN